MNRRRNKRQSAADGRSVLSRFGLPCHLAPAGRFGLSIAALLVIYLGVLWINRGYARGEVVPFPVPLSQLPSELGAWQGAERELDDRVFRSLDAVDQVSRSYVNARGDEVSVHLATWQDYEGFTPHQPQVCLQGAGYTVGRDRALEVNQGADEQFTARFVEAQRERDPIQELYWYQLGDHVYTDRTSGKAVERQLWSSTSKPALVKVLLATRVLDAEESREQLTEVAGLVRAWLASHTTSKPIQ